MDRDDDSISFDAAAAARYIASVRWTFARTMPDWPHEYTVKAWHPELAALFEAICELIRMTGFVEPWPPAPAAPIYHNHYLILGDRKYWAMGADGDRGPVSSLTVLNRTAAEDRTETQA